MRIVTIVTIVTRRTGTLVAALGAVTALSLAGPAGSQQKKEADGDVLYEEGRVPHYDLPELLETAEGRRITTVEEWHRIRRPQILALFSNVLYGRVPVPQNPIRTEWEVVATDPGFLGGRATRRDVAIRFANDRGSVEMRVLVFVPNDRDEPVPAILQHSFSDTRGDRFDAHPTDDGHLRTGVPLGEILERGYAFVAVYQQDLVRHNEVSFDRGIAPLFYRDDQSFPKAHEWGVLTIVSWGAMRALDYLEQDAGVDAGRVVVMGHSKMGKAALWTAAQDERVALAISAQSGAGGAALWRRKYGETLEKMVTRFPYWLSRNAWKFVHQEDDLPVDQHMLLALIAPRPVYVASGEDDTWADARGEYLSAHHASEVYRLFGERGLDSEASPDVGRAVLDGHVGYHVRAGGHSIEPYDWQRFLDFADRHLRPN